MKQTRSTLMLLAVAVLVAIGLPYYLSNQKASALDVKTKGLKSEEAAFKAKSITGEKIRKAKAEWTAQQAVLAAAMPADPDIQGAIRTLQGLTEGDAAPDHVRWISANVSNLKAAQSPVPAVATTVKTGSAAPKTTPKTSVAEGSTSPVGSFEINISVEGSRTKVLAFVTKIQQRPEELRRLFAVKSVNLTVESTIPSNGGAAPVSNDPNVTAGLRLEVTTFGVPSEKATADAAAVIAKVPAGAAASVAPAATTASTTIATKP
jgi:hypothetical protein